MNNFIFSVSVCSLFFFKSFQYSARNFSLILNLLEHIKGNYFKVCGSNCILDSIEKLLLILLNMIMV